MLGELGESCTEDQACEAGLECRDDICSMPLGMLGENCIIDEQCLSGLECRA